MTTENSVGGLFAAWWRNLSGSFADGARAATALPALTLLMVGIEFAQHVVEVKLGFFSVDPAVRKAASLDPLRMAFGWPKMVTVWALAFFAIRFLAVRDARAALRPSLSALRRYWWVIVFQLVPFVMILYAPVIVTALGLGSDAVLPLRGIFGLGQQLLEPALCLWFVSAALGDDRFGPVSSAFATLWLYVWALPLIFLARIPFNAAHQLLNTHAAGKSGRLLWAMLALDAVVVVALVTVMAAAQVRVAAFIAERRDLTASIRL